MPLEAYLRTLDPEDRPLAREWGTMGAGEFQARVGPQVERLAEMLEGTDDPPWYNLRLADIAKVAGGGGLGSAVAALLAHFG